MKSGAWRNGVLPGTVLRGTVVCILKFYSGNGGAKFSKKISLLLKRS